MADEKRTQFDYLLNAFERASQSDKPAENGYRDKRLALFAYVRQLEAVAQQSEAPRWDPVSNVDRLIADGIKRHGYRQGTKECIAFFQGACYAVECNAGVAPSQEDQRG